MIQQRSVDKAVDFLRQRIANGDWPQGTRLPICKALAQNADVGGNSMLAAIARLKKEGLLAAKRKQGIFVGSSVPFTQHHQTIPDSRRWERVKDLIKKDLLTGAFHELETLPTLKELCVHYKTNFPNIKRAVRALVSEKMLTEGKRLYHISHLRIKNTSNTIYLFINEIVRFMEMWNTERDIINFFIQKLEKECYARGIVLKKRWFAKGSKVTDIDKNCLGCIILCAVDDNESLVNYGEIFTIMTELKLYKKPLSLVNIAELNRPFNVRIREFCIKNAIFFTEIMHNRLAGSRVGRFLLAKGHKKICFFSHNSNVDRWKERLEGVKEVYTSAGIPDGVVPLFADQADGTTRVTGKKTPKYLVNVPYEQIKYDTFQGIVLLKQVPSPSSFTKTLIKQLIYEEAELSNTPPPSSGTLSVPFDTGREHLLNAHALTYRHRIPPVFKRQLISMHHEALNRFNLLETFTPLFQKALAMPDVHAWVCVEDFLTNYAAVQFLQARKIKVPEQIALIGFQDLFESALGDISSYRFDFADAAIKALTCILYPKHSEKSLCIKGSRQFEVDGMVIDRGSV